MRSNDEVSETADPELRAVLDAELHRLPARYRTALILCYLQGRTNEEAAQELGWPAGTVKSRLARGRDLLRDRLTRRGVGTAATGLGAALTESATAAVPAPLAEATTAAALGYISTIIQGDLAMRAPAAVLADRVLRGMMLTRLRWLAVGVALLAVTASASWLALHASSTVASPAAPAAPEAV